MYTYSHTYLNDSQKYPSFVCIFLCIPPLNIFPFILFGVSQLMLCPEIIFGCATFHMQINQHKMICCFFITYWYAYRHFSLLLSWTIIQKYCLYVWNLISIYICMYVFHIWKIIILSLAFITNKCEHRKWRVEFNYWLTDTKRLSRKSSTVKTSDELLKILAVNFNHFECIIYLFKCMYEYFKILILISIEYA